MDMTFPAEEIRMACLNCGETWYGEAFTETDTGYYGPTEDAYQCPTCGEVGEIYENLSSGERFRLEWLRMTDAERREYKRDCEADELLSSGY